MPRGSFVISSGRNAFYIWFQFLLLGKEGDGSVGGPEIDGLRLEFLLFCWSEFGRTNTADRGHSLKTYKVDSDDIFGTIFEFFGMPNRLLAFSFFA